MAELGLALLAVPGSTVELFKLAKLAVERIKCFRHTSSFLNKLKAFGYDLCDGQLHLAVQLVENFVTDDRSRNGKLESLAKKHLEKWILEKSVYVDGHVNWWYYTVKGERELKRILKNLQKWQYDFTVLIILAEKSRQISLRNMLLTLQRFCLISQNKDVFLGLLRHIPVLLRRSIKMRQMDLVLKIEVIRAKNSDLAQIF